MFCNAAPGCRSVWYRPRHEPGGAAERDGHAPLPRLGRIARHDAHAFGASGLKGLLAGADTAADLGYTAFMQNLLAGLADSATVFGGLHVLDGLLILAIAGSLYASARWWRS